jgi:hypothetical protein
MKGSMKDPGRRSVFDQAEYYEAVDRRWRLDVLRAVRADLRQALWEDLEDSWQFVLLELWKYREGNPAAWADVGKLFYILCYRVKCSWKTRVSKLKATRFRDSLRPLGEVLAEGGEGQVVPAWRAAYLGEGVLQWLN